MLVSTIEVMATHRYRYTGSQPVHFPAIGAEVKPGDVVETEHTIHHPDFEEVRETKKGEAKNHK